VSGRQIDELEVARVVTSAIIGSSSCAICSTTAAGNEQAMIVDGTSRRASLRNRTWSRITRAGIGIAR